jgi:hypothetical protein
MTAAVTPPLRTVTLQRMDELKPPFKPGGAAEPLYRPDLAPAAFLAALLDAKLYPDAIRLLAAVLPRRDAVAWAAGCVRDGLGPAPSAKAAAALAAVERWLAGPSDANARAAGEAAEAAGTGTPAGCLASALFYTGSNIGPAGGAVVAPPAQLPAALIAGAVLLAAVAREPEKAVERFAGYTQKGIAHANAERPAKR